MKFPVTLLFFCLLTACSRSNEPEWVEIIAQDGSSFKYDKNSLKRNGDIALIYVEMKLPASSAKVEKHLVSSAYLAKFDCVKTTIANSQISMNFSDGTTLNEKYWPPEAIPTDVPMMRIFEYACQAQVAESANVAEINNVEVKAEPDLDNLIKVTSVKLAYDYDQNTVAANNIYKGKRFKIYGLITDINTDIMGNGYITMHGINLYLQPQFSFGKEAMDQLATLRKDQAITLVCTGNGDIAKIPMSNDCEIIAEEIDEPNQPQESSDPTQDVANLSDKAEGKVKRKFARGIITWYGQLVNNYDNMLSLDGRTVEPQVLYDGTDETSVIGEYKIGSSYIVLFLQSINKDCPGNFVFVTVTEDGAIASKNFGTCIDDMSKPIQNGNSISFEMPNLDGNGKSTFTYEAGTVLQNGMPIE